MPRSRPWIAAVLLLFAVCIASGCNTIRGMGKDLEQAGEAIQKGSQEASR